MADRTREQMIAGAMLLLGTKGVQGTSLNKVLEVTGAPRGSIYHHFPGGKDELITAALELTGSLHDDWVTRYAGTSVEEIVAGFLDFWRQTLVRSDLESGCPVLAVAVSAPSGTLFTKAGEVFAASLRHLIMLLCEVRLTETVAADLATTLVASAEGAVVLARAQRDLAPFELVASHLMELARRVGAEAMAAPAPAV